MKFIHIDPASMTVALVGAEDPRAAAPKLYRRGVDHGVIWRKPNGNGVSIVVYEYGLVDCEPPYFAIGKSLYSGEALLYGFNGYGETVDVTFGKDDQTELSWWVKNITWLPDNADVETAIAAGTVNRPETSVNGAVLWRWPDKGPRQ